MSSILDKKIGKRKLWIVDTRIQLLKCWDNIWDRRTKWKKMRILQRQLKSQCGQCINVNSKRYAEMINGLFWIVLQDSRGIDGALAHTANVSMKAVRQLFQGNKNKFEHCDTK